MPLPASGAITMAQIATEFGGAAPHALSEYYGKAVGIPASGQISMSHFHGKRAGPPPGQVVFTTTQDSQTFSWTVPADVTSISMVCVQPGGDYGSAKVTISSVEVCRASGTNYRIGDGGGNGGSGGSIQYDAFDRPYGSSGGGGAGGYSGNGGSGGSTSHGGNGSGGGGGGGGGGNSNGGGGWGGGVGLLGEGASGLAGKYGLSGGAERGGSGSGGTGMTYGGGGGSYRAAGKPGGALSYKNNVPVTPGQTVTISLSRFDPLSGQGAVRIMWGGNRSYPNNAGDM